MNDKRIAVMWSGGKDSTYLIMKALEAGELVTGLYVQVENNQNKVGSEIKALEALTWEIQNLYPKQFEVKTIASVDLAETYDVKWGQPVIWLFAASYVVSSEKFKSLQVGYILCDGIISYLDDLKSLWKMMAGIVRRDEPVPLEFPLWRTDSGTIKDYFHYHNDLKQHLVFCENPVEGAPCHYCDKCKVEGLHFMDRVKAAEEELQELCDHPKNEPTQEIVRAALTN